MTQKQLDQFARLVLAVQRDPAGAAAALWRLAAGSGLTDQPTKKAGRQ